MAVVVMAVVVVTVVATVAADFMEAAAILVEAAVFVADEDLAEGMAEVTMVADTAVDQFGLLPDCADMATDMGTDADTTVWGRRIGGPTFKPDLSYKAYV